MMTMRKKGGFHFHPVKATLKAPARPKRPRRPGPSARSAPKVPTNTNPIYEILRKM